MWPKPLAEPNDVAEALAPPLRLCGLCRKWNSKPCGDGCVLMPTDPTFAEVCEEARNAIARTPQVSTMTGGYQCQGCGGSSHDNLRCTACGFSPLDEEPTVEQIP